MMPAGKYYVGDLCYVLGDRWDEFCSLTISGCRVLSGQFTFKDGTTFWTHCTAYGDGTYTDQLGREYSVDAGLIGVVAIENIDPEPNCIKGGQVITFSKDFEPSYRDGVFYISNIVINTEDCYSDVEYDDDEQWDDED
jgi:hypothetical protein